MLTVFAGSLEGKGGNELWTKQGKEEGERDYGKYFGFDEKLIEKEVIFLVRTTRFKWREGKKNRGRRKFGCGERSFGITAISPVVEPFLPYPRYYFPAPGQEVRLPSPFPRTKRFDGGRPIVSSTTVVGISSGLEDFRNAATLWSGRLTGWKLRKEGGRGGEEAESQGHPDDGGGEGFSFRRRRRWSKFRQTWNSTRARWNSATCFVKTSFSLPPAKIVIAPMLVSSVICK